MLGAVSARIQSINGVPFVRENLRGVARRYSRTVSVSPVTEKPAFTEITAGQWWDARWKPAHSLRSGGRIRLRKF